jgi:hypothetical protein
LYSPAATLEAQFLWWLSIIKNGIFSLYKHQARVVPASPWPTIMYDVVMLTLINSSNYLKLYGNWSRQSINFNGGSAR